MSDILIENEPRRDCSGSGWLTKTASAINQRLIMISMLFGLDGPECNARGYGNMVEAMAGVTGTTGYH